MQFIRNELVSLKDMGFLRGKFEEEVNWKTLALNNITLLKDKIKVINIYISYLRNSNLVFFELSHKINILIRLEKRHASAQTYSYNNK